MSDDAKLDFYLKNRALVEEWAALRKPVANALDQALLSAVEQMTRVDDVPTPRIKEDRARTVKLDISREPLLPGSWVELWWQQTDLLKGSAGWPYLVVVMDPKHPKPLREAVRSASVIAREKHGLSDTGNSNHWWLRSGRITPPSEPIEIEAYAMYCSERLRDLWLAVNDPVSAAVKAYAPRGSSD